MFSLINTFISTLSQESKNTLITHEIKIPEVANLTFDYPSFLRVIDMLCIDLAVKDWFAHPNYGKISYTSTQIKLLLSILTTHLLHNSSFIDTLKISHTTIIKTTGTTSDIILDIIHQIPKTTKNCFSNLKEFQYNSDTPIMEDLFLKLSQITISIERICFTIYKNMTNSALTLLKSQRNLKELTIQYHIMYDILIDQKAVSTFLDKSNSLTHLTLEKLYFPLNYLENFKILQELSLTDCGYHDYNIKDWLSFSLISLPNLKKLVYKNPNPIYLDIFAKFISNTNFNNHFGGSKLSQIIIQCCKFQNPDHSNLLLSTISSNCPLLSFYSGPISSKNTLELSQLLISCPFIKNLRLHPLTSICSLNNPLISDSEPNLAPLIVPETRSSFDPLLLELCKAPLLHLDTLTIVHGWKIHSNIFEHFLKIRQKNGNIDGILRGFNFYWNNTVVIGDLVKICEEYPDIIKYGSQTSTNSVLTNFKPSFELSISSGLPTPTSHKFNL
ncbi:10973_t:CDS:2 [Funneliformis mosseae]|uniref:10973_t:CDS:1 n=2 Tax=Funneliformis TaxID=1117308 RepID=A0A9N8Z1T4_FUNMO|nr:10973_t:CDS:2 [Funneliformis mosseae]